MILCEVIMEELKMIIAGNIGKLRREAGITQTDLAEILKEAGMSSNNPWEWVRLTHGVTWHDHIWILFDDEKLTWEEVRLCE